MEESETFPAKEKTNPPKCQLKTADSRSRERAQGWLEWFWDYLQSGYSHIWRLSREPLAWAYSSVTRAWHILALSSDLAADTECAPSDRDSLQSDGSNQESPRGHTGGGFSRCWDSFLSESSDRNPLVSAGQWLGRCCSSLWRVWVDLTWSWPNPVADCWRSTAACRKSSRPTWNLVTLCLEPLARCWGSVRRGCRSCGRGYSLLALGWNLCSRVRDALARGLASLGSCWGSLSRSWGSLSRGWGSLARCCHRLDRCPNPLNRTSYCKIPR